MVPESIYVSGSYLAKNPTWHQEDSPWKAEKIKSMLNKHLIAPSSVCEIGCGSGEILNILARDSSPKVKYYGYEISPQAFDICRGKEKSNLKFFLKDLFEEKERFFDLVLAIDVLEHVEDYYGFLRMLQGKGTYKLFHIPLDLSAQGVVRNLMMLSRKTVGHIHYFNKDTAIATLQETGYQIIDYFYTEKFSEIHHKGWKSNLARIPRRMFFNWKQDLAVRVLGGCSLLVLAK